MPKLDIRLRTVARQIHSSTTHVDIGSDHAGLLVALLRSGRVQRGIAIENKQQPYENSQSALASLAADVRFGEGLEVLQTGEAESLSICGMGGESIVKILEAFPDRVPPRVVLQPNRQPELIRRWALRNSFHLMSEEIARGHWPYSVMSFQISSDGDDPAYQNVDFQSALLFGPLILKRFDAAFVHQLRQEQAYWAQFDCLEPQRRERLALIENLIQSGSGVINDSTHPR